MMAWTGSNFGIDKDVCINCPHRSAAIHQIEQRVTINQVYSWQLNGFPAPEAELVRLARSGRETPANSVIGHRLERATFFGRLLL